MAVTGCDVLVVGGGPAGSTCAARLIRAGLDVVVMDKSPFPRDKTCAGWITPQVVETLGLDLADYAAGQVLQRITGFVTGLVGRKPRLTLFDSVVSYGIRRCEFDHYLLERSGARLRLGEAVTQIERHDAGWRINGAIEARMLIGAGGHFCPVARHLGARLGHDEPVISAQEVEFRIGGEACGVQGSEPELYFCDDLKGYGWCFRKGDFLNVGLGREGNRGLAAEVKCFWEWLAARGKVPHGPMPRLKGHAYLLHGRGSRQRYDDATLLIGDAAGLAYPQSGEGIRPAIESGILAAQVVAAAGGNYSRVRLRDYDDRLMQRLGGAGNPSPHAPPLRPAWRVALGRRLLGSAWFARHVVIERWFLHAHQPALPYTGVAGD